MVSLRVTSFRLVLQPQLGRAELAFRTARIDQDFDVE